MVLPFPTLSGIYDGFAVRVDGETVPIRYSDGAAVATFELPARATSRVETGYRTAVHDRLSAARADYDARACQSSARATHAPTSLTPPPR